VHELIASRFLDDYLLLRPGSPRGIKIGARRHRELKQSTGKPCPAWLVDAVRRRWPDLDLTDRRLDRAVLVRPTSPYGYGRASYEVNLGCNYDCEHCYLGLKKFEGLSWRDRERLLDIMRDAGVLWLQLTGGEPLIDKLFPDVYRLAFELGMMLSISSNGSRLHNPAILELLTTLRPYRLTISVYGATAESYDGLTRRRGSVDKFMKGMTAANEAGLPPPDTRSSTSTPTAWPASARSAATPKSRSWRKGSKD
jgi:sulfatase maturation enzyme AslB (radical SAM superfamily)